ncbi:uncharacterized protein LOC445211 [Danio rerio]|uniref:Calmin n=1 Tax=Danio rerio TaxID=7955 RepID=Q6DBX6_DANRE|nr:uncharacterized protein LOC445211 [Danio rerio]AAH78322.1 Zgc:100997 [Danio rerio]|eukprot:NP_001003605.1 calmin [Danio rerio]
MTSRLSERNGQVGKEKKCKQRAQDERHAVQERTFTKWINMQLKSCEPPLQVHHLFTDIQDGKVLMALLEELSGCNLLDKFRPFPHRIFRLNNISKVLNFLKDRNISLVNIEADDIADGSPSAVLRLIWNIIVYYQIKQVTRSLEKSPSTFSLLSLPCDSDSSGRSSPASPGDDIFGTLPSKGKKSLKNLKYRGTAIKTLLSWAQNCTAKYGVEIRDFGKSWRSGLAFVALVKFFCPEFVHMRKALSSEPRLNMETAFRAAQEWLGIPPLLNPDDVAVHSPDEQSIITYIAQFLECCPGHDEDAMSTDSSRGTPNSTERWDRVSTDSDSCVFPSNVSTEALRDLYNLSETSEEEQTYHTGDQESLSVCQENIRDLAARSESLLNVKKTSTGGQCCDSIAWRKRWIGSLEDDGNCSEVSKEAVYSLSVLDSDEEDAFSYILELDHKDSGLESNIDFGLNTVMDSQAVEFDLNVASIFETQESEIKYCCCEAQRNLKATDVSVRSGGGKCTNKITLDQVRPTKSNILTENNCDEKTLPASDTLLMNQNSIEKIENNFKLYTDERPDLNCSLKMKESDSADAFTHSNGTDDAFVHLDNCVDEDKLREELFLCPVKENLLDNDQYEQNNVLDRSVLDGITEEPAVSHAKRKEGLDQASYEVQELHMLLFLWMIAYCVLMYPHLDIFSLLSPN